MISLFFLISKREYGGLDVFGMPLGCLTPSTFWKLMPSTCYSIYFYNGMVSTFLYKINTHKNCGTYFFF